MSDYIQQLHEVPAASPSSLCRGTRRRRPSSPPRQACRPLLSPRGLANTRFLQQSAGCSEAAEGIDMAPGSRRSLTRASFR